MKILQINVLSNSGSTGKIAEGIGKLITDEGWESHIAYGRFSTGSKYSKEINIGNRLDIYRHVLLTRLSDQHGLGSKNATLDLIKEIEQLSPDLIHLHVIHGYYINYDVLFSFFKSYKKIPIIWTFHDCWAFTGHCAHFISINCRKWETQCYECELKGAYPKSFVDRSFKNFIHKKNLFSSLDNLTIVSPSKWLLSEVKRSFFKGVDLRLIPNGIDLKKFNISHDNGLSYRKKMQIDDKVVILGIASVWTENKGYNDFIRLNEILDDRYKIIMVGLSHRQLKSLPKEIIGIERTESFEQLAEIYTVADVFFNPTYEDTFPTTNIESLACGTPVITYDVGGSPEIIDEQTGCVVDKGDFQKIINVIDVFTTKGREVNSFLCRNRAEILYNDLENFKNYMHLYKEKLNL